MKNKNAAGTLAVDIYQTPTHVIVLAPIAGIDSKELDIQLEGQKLTIIGNRKHANKNIAPQDYLAQECYWGDFKREIILPVFLDTEQIDAQYKNGILQIKIPKKSAADVKQVPLK